MAQIFELTPIEETEEQRRPVELIIPPVAKTEIMSVRVTPETKKNLETLAKKHKMSMSEVLRQLAEQGMERVNRK